MHPFLAQAIPQTKLLYIQTFGCQMNEYDSARVERMLTLQGYRLTHEIQHADVIFVNTCAVREKAEQKVYSFLGRLRPLKAHHPGLKILIAGCIAQQLGKKLLTRFDHLDLVLGTRSLAALPNLFEKIQATGARLAHLKDEENTSDASRDDCLTAVRGVTATVTIMQGCDNYCSYCIVPYVRGTESSRPSREILKEIQALVAGGVGEVTLLGQNVNSYGKKSVHELSFAGLLQKIQAETAVKRLRFTTSHPKDLTEEVMLCFTNLKSLCHNLHLPVQAGSDRILKLMNRGYTATEYLEKIERLRQLCPDIGLSTDFMVGFPGEAEQDFQDTLRLLEQVQFDTLFSFCYSDRPHAKAIRFPDKVPDRDKHRRLVELQALQAKITLRRNQNEIGRMREILVEGPSKAGGDQWMGRTQQNRIVNFESPVDLTGQLVRVRIVAAYSHSLRGELMNGYVGPSPSSPNTR
jgi:tRNA-2-methylthio-N6-dimethylallyladenosine synthase